MPLTPLAELAEHRLGSSLRRFVRDRRARGKSWRQISMDLYRTTGMDITHEGLRRWFPDPPRAE